MTFLVTTINIIITVKSVILKFVRGRQRIVEARSASRYIGSAEEALILAGVIPEKKKESEIVKVKPERRTTVDHIVAAGIGTAFILILYRAYFGESQPPQVFAAQERFSANVTAFFRPIELPPKSH